MSDLKQAEIDELLAFFSPRLREILERVAYYDRRSVIQELIWLIEARAAGKLLNKEDGANPVIPLEELPSPLVERAGILQTHEPNPGKGYRRPSSSNNDTSNGPPSKT